MRNIKSGSRSILVMKMSDFERGLIIGLFCGFAIAINIINVLILVGLITV